SSRQSSTASTTPVHWQVKARGPKSSSDQTSVLIIRVCPYRQPAELMLDGHHRCDMDATLIRQLIQRRLWDGRLPYVDSIELSFGPGTGHNCDGCGTAIMLYRWMTVRIDVHDWREMRFHEKWFEIWDDERVKDAQRRPSHSSRRPTSQRPLPRA